MFVFVVLLLLWPIAEIVTFVWVAQWLGVLNTLGLMVAISVFGAWLVKRQGVGTLARMRRELDDGRIPTGPMTDGGLLAVAGFLLLVPGFITDAFGLLLLVPPVRAGMRHWLARRFRVRVARTPRPPNVGYSGYTGYLDVESGGVNPPRRDPPELLP